MSRFLVLLIIAVSVLIGGTSAQQAAASSATPQAKSETSSAGSASAATPAQVSGQPAPAEPSQASPVKPADTQKSLAIPRQTPAVDPTTGIPLYETIEEDWSSLKIGVSKLQPEPPLMGQVEEQEKFTRELVSVKWRPGDAIDLWIIRPKGVTKPPVVLYLYNFADDTDRFRSDGWAQRTTGGGVAAVGFVSALSGHRFHDRPMKQWFVSELQESIGSTVHDVQLILDYLAQRGDLDMDRVGMFGTGSGGAIAILAAAVDPRIKALDLLDPWGDWPEFLAKSNVVLDDPNHDKYVTPEFLKQVEPLEPVHWLPQLKIPIRIQQVRESDLTPMECKEKIKAVAPSQTEVARFATVDDLRRDEGHGQVFDWIKTKVQEPGKPGAGSDSKLSAAEGNASQTAPAQHP